MRDGTPAQPCASGTYGAWTARVSRGAVGARKYTFLALPETDGTPAQPCASGTYAAWAARVSRGAVGARTYLKRNTSAPGGGLSLIHI